MPVPLPTTMLLRMRADATPFCQSFIPMGLPMIVLLATRAVLPGPMPTRRATLQGLFRKTLLVTTDAGPMTRTVLALCCWSPPHEVVLNQFRSTVTDQSLVIAAPEPA